MGSTSAYEAEIGLGMGGRTTGLQLDAVVPCHETDWSAGLKSPAAGSSASGCGSPGIAKGDENFQVGVGLPPDPFQLVSKLLSLDLSVADAVRLTQQYYETCGNGSELSERSIISASSAPSGVSRRSQRKREWEISMQRLADLPGHCYLRVVRYGRRRRFARLLNADPTITAFVEALRPCDLDFAAARNNSIYYDRDACGKSAYHIAVESQEGQHLGSFLAFLATCFKCYPFLNVGGFELDGFLDTRPTLSATVGRVPLRAAEPLLQTTTLGRVGPSRVVETVRQELASNVSSSLVVWLGSTTLVRSADHSVSGVYAAMLFPEEISEAGVAYECCFESARFSALVLSPGYTLLHEGVEYSNATGSIIAFFSGKVAVTILCDGLSQFVFDYANDNDTDLGQLILSSVVFRRHALLGCDETSYVLRSSLFRYAELCPVRMQRVASDRQEEWVCTTRGYVQYASMGNSVAVCNESSSTDGIIVANDAVYLHKGHIPVAFPHLVCIKCEGVSAARFTSRVFDGFATL